jgi:hypothetical protein
LTCRSSAKPRTPSPTFPGARGRPLNDDIGGEAGAWVIMHEHLVRVVKPLPAPTTRTSRRCFFEGLHVELRSMYVDLPSVAGALGSPQPFDRHLEVVLFVDQRQVPDTGCGPGRAHLRHACIPAGSRAASPLDQSWA